MNTNIVALIPAVFFVAILGLGAMSGDREKGTTTVAPDTMGGIETPIENSAVPIPNQISNQIPTSTAISENTEAHISGL